MSRKEMHAERMKSNPTPYSLDSGKKKSDFELFFFF